jgi:hypothetical protein
MTTAQLSTCAQAASCDRCGPAVKAQTMAIKGSQYFFLCGHHTVTTQSALIAQGWTVAPLVTPES